MIWPQVYIGERSRLRQSVVCSSATLKPDVLLEDASVIGDDCTMTGARSVGGTGGTHLAGQGHRARLGGPRVRHLGRDLAQQPLQQVRDHRHHQC